MRSLHPWIRRHPLASSPAFPCCSYLTGDFGPNFVLTAATGMRSLECRRKEGERGLITITVTTSVGSRSFGA